MGCSESKKGESVPEVAGKPSEAAGKSLSEEMKRVIAIVKNGNGSRLLELYNRWPVDGEPVEITLADGSKRKSWPRKWSDLEKDLLNLHVIVNEPSGALCAEDVAAMKAETVGNPKKPHLTEDCMTWPGIQTLFRDAHEDAFHEKWDPQKHQMGMDYFACLRMNSLSIKKEGLAKKLSEIGAVKAIDFIWDVFAAWPNDMGKEVEVMRMDRRNGQPQAKMTWPLKFDCSEDPMDIDRLLTSCGWDDMLIAALKYQLFDNREESKVHANCNLNEITWPDLQQVFRSCVSDDPWSDDLSAEWPPLDPKVTLRLKIPKDRVEDVLKGEWRMYCKPDEGEAFSYGLMITVVDIVNWKFEGRSRIEGKYVLEEGKISHVEKDGRCNITYTEVWPNGTRDKVSARVKSNGKFQCESQLGFEQKATREDLNLPNETHERIGEEAKPGIKKYYLHDNDAAVEEEVEAAADSGVTESVDVSTVTENGVTTTTTTTTRTENGVTTTETVVETETEVVEEVEEEAPEGEAAPVS